MLRSAVGIASNGTWDSEADWSLLPRAEGACTHYQGAYVSIMSGEAPIEQVVCLHRQLNRWGPTCPLLLFYHDHPAALPSATALGKLRSALGEANVQPTSWLFEKANLTLRSNAHVMGWSASQRSSSTASTTSSRVRSRSGRRLLAVEGQYLFWGTLTKLSLFALSSYRRLVFLDLDIVLLRPLDALMSVHMGNSHFAAAGIGGNCPRFAFEPFNFGIGVLRPSRKIADELLLRICLRYYNVSRFQGFTNQFGDSCSRLYTRWNPKTVPGHMRSFSKVCERFRTDQSLFNQHFRANYLRLPYSYNVVPTRWKRPPPFSNASSRIAVLHFVGDPKPWQVLNANGSRPGMKYHIHSISSKLWAEACYRDETDATVLSSRMESLASKLLGRREIK